MAVVGSGYHQEMNTQVYTAMVPRSRRGLKGGQQKSTKRIGDSENIDFFFEDLLF
jgi:hypothetical protein